MIESVLAAVVLAACVLMAIRFALGAQRRQRADAVLRDWARSVRTRVLSVRHRRSASRAADDAIRRARGRGEWDGNVYKPKSFRKPPRDKMH